LVGGFINQYTDWRWSFYVLLIWAGVLLCLIILFVPETYHPVILRKKAIKLRKQTGEPRWQAPIEKLDRSVARTVMWSCIRPFQLLFLEPMVSSREVYLIPNQARVWTQRREPYPGLI
jgi:MFS family permease